LADGTIEYLGRNDFQVKIRGFRIELGEIEAKLAALGAEEAGDVVVLAREDQPGDKRLVTYYTGHATAEQLRAQAQATLPSYMVPAAYVQLSALPLTPNGKLDRKALPAPDEQAWSRRAYEAPQGEVEATLAAIWAELLQIERVGRHDNFFELGGHSLLAVQLASRLREACGAELPLNAMFEQPVLCEMAQQVLLGPDTQDPPLQPVSRQGELPLSLAQQRLWFLAQMEGAAGAYHISGAVRLTGRLDIDALRRAVRRIVARHETLRTHYRVVEGQACQIIASTAEPQWSEVDLQGSVDSGVLEAHAAQPFDLAQGAPLRLLLARVGEQDHLLQLVMHHVAADGWSIAVLLGELRAFYKAELEGGQNPLPPLVIQYADFASWQRRMLSGARLEAQGQYWQRTLAGAPTLLELPSDRSRPERQDYRGDSIEVRLDARLVAGLRALSQRHGVTLYMTALASWAMLLGRLAGQDDVVVGSPVAGRQRLEVEPLIGCFVNTLALRVNLGGEPSVAELLARTRAQVLAAQEHQDLPFEQVVERVQPARSLSHPPLFQHMLAWQNTPPGELNLPGLTVSSVDVAQKTAMFDLTLSMQEQEDELVGSLEYATALFERRTVERFLGYWQRLLEAMVADEQMAVGRLPILPAAEREQVLRGWNQTQEA
ncbi:condensation domain-containing protein, partial [Pelomonas sp. BJYL3]|uniref:condensation domain-containing protein n=1 Tax=Pelomonas sp. BJYL3 TaxID=2976697 RepID=UPI0022B5CB88